MSTEPTFDSRTEQNIATLVSPLQHLAREFLVAAQKALPSGVTVKIISGLRTYAEQDALYAKGRTAPGPKVTNAPAGYSNHNFGTAFDVGLFKGSDYLEDSPLYEKLGPVGEGVGLSWGGRWTSIKDFPHYELITGLSLAEMRERKANGTPLLKGTKYDIPTTSTPTPAASQWTVQVLDGKTGQKRPVDANSTDEIRFVAEEMGGLVKVVGKVITITKPGAQAADG